MQNGSTQGAIRSETANGRWLVCGWFTEDNIYRPLAEQLAASLDAVQAPYDLAPASKREGSWEANTMQKPRQLLAAMDRHPDNTIIFLDVDFTAVGDLSPLADAPGDVALKMKGRRRRNGSSRLLVSSQIIVVKPTQSAREFISAWVRLSEQGAQWGDTAETYLPLVFGEVASCSVGLLDQAHTGAILIHHWANRSAGRQARGRFREIANLSRWVISPFTR